MEKNKKNPKSFVFLLQRLFIDPKIIKTFLSFAQKQGRQLFLFFDKKLFFLHFWFFL